MEGGLSTYGNCDFILSWAILKGHAGETDLSGLNVCMAGTYDDPESQFTLTFPPITSDIVTEIKNDLTKLKRTKSKKLI